VHDGRELACARQVRTASPVATQHHNFLGPEPSVSRIHFCSITATPSLALMPCPSPTVARCITHCRRLLQHRGPCKLWSPHLASASPLKQHILLLPTQYSDMPLRVNLFPPLVSLSLPPARTHQLTVFLLNNPLTACLHHTERSWKQFSTP
jgi:hypothetical protein